MIRSVSGKETTALGLGGAWLGWSFEGNDPEIGKQTVLKALELGINLIDTSGTYQKGESERIIGRAVSEWVRSGGDREDLVISTKTGTRVRPVTEDSYSAQNTRDSIEMSLSALGVDYLDVALVHDPPDFAIPLRPGYAWDTLQELKHEGKVRATGLGYRGHTAHQRFIDTGCCDVCLTHNDFNLLNRTALHGVMEPAAAAGTAVFNASLTAGRLLTGQDPGIEYERWQRAMETRTPPRPDAVANYKARAEAAGHLWRWSQDVGVDLNAVNIQLSTRHPLVSATLIGASNADIVETNLRASETDIPSEVWEDLRKVLSLSDAELPFLVGDEKA